MKVAVVQLQSVSPYSQSKHYEVPKENKESPAAYEKRTWRERCHADDKGQMFIPPMAFKNTISDAARFLGERIPGKGQQTWSKHFEAGVLVTDPLPLGIKKDDVSGEWLFVPSDGKKGGGKRVMKCFPVIQQWEGEMTFYVLDDMITEDVFRHHLEQAGAFVGLGRFRPQRGGFYGRFKVVNMTWKDG